MVNRIRELIDQSSRIVVLGGENMVKDNGLNGVRQEDRAYDIEMKYGYSPEEIVTTAFLMRRVELFYQYYKEEVLDLDHMYPGRGYQAIGKLQKRGKLSAVITNTVYGLYQMAGVQNVVELHGNVHDNRCPQCGKIYSAEYIKNSVGVPLCEQCRIVLKPGFSMYGDNMDNGRVSRAAEYASQADLLLVAGAALDSCLPRWLLKYYQGDRLILVNHKEGHCDYQANHTLYGRCDEVLTQIIP